MFPVVVILVWERSFAQTVAAASELLGAVPMALAWLLAAFGLGWLPRRRLAPRTGDSTNGLDGVLQLGLGLAILLFLDSSIGALGILGPRSAWGLIFLGVALALTCLRFDPPGRSHVSPMVAVGAPAIGVLLVAATSAPGWLWSTEFSGYDALSYHLQLPKEWLLAGRVGATPHCVYGHLPSFMETGFLHVMALRGTTAEAAHQSAVTAQVLHALLAILAAWCAGQAAARWCGPASSGNDEVQERWNPAAVAAGVAMILVLATPWVVVVGSLAYNEMPVLLLLACGLAILSPGRSQEQRMSWPSKAMVVGALAGAACGAKLTAALFVAAPLGVLLLWSLPPRRWLAAATLSTLAATAMLLPWLIRNWIATGNPVFPFATGILGHGHWSAEQAAIFARGHASDLSLADRLLRLWQQFFAFGLGPNPAPGEPWRPLWAATPWLTLLAVAVLLWPDRTGRPPSQRRAVVQLTSVLAMQLAAWMTLTHLQSRFLLPSVVPMAMLIGIAASRLAGAPAGVIPRASARSPSAVRRWLPMWSIPLLALSLAPLAVYQRERGGAPSAAIGAGALFAGEGPTGSPAEENPGHWLNHRLSEGSRVLLVGDAKPFWYLGSPAAYVWQTTWDRGPLSRVLAEHPGDPPAQRRALREDGFTHLLVDSAMLDRWRRSGWNDPLLTPEAVAPLTGHPNRVIKRFVGGAVLVELAGD